MGGFLSEIPVWLVCYAHGFHVHLSTDKAFIHVKQN